MGMKLPGLCIMLISCIAIALMATILSVMMSSRHRRPARRIVEPALGEQVSAQRLPAQSPGAGNVAANPRPSISPSSG